MTLNREKNAYFFPSKVYRCACLGQTVDYCFENDLNPFNEIHDEINSFVLSNGDMDKVFTTKCGENKKDCIFVCQKHLAIVILAKKTYSCTEKPKFDNTTVFYNSVDGNSSTTETFCSGCIRYYLRLTFEYFYHKDF